jgi:tetratricopeptide (TPR) repeat protein
MTTGRAGLAVPIFIKLVAEFPGEARYLSLLVHCQHSAGEHTAALASLEQWEQYAPGNAEAAMLRVVSLIALSHDAAAALAMETLVLQHGSAPDRARPIADILALLGQWQASSEYAARAVEHDPNAPEPRLSAARAALELGHYEQCAEYCMDATERDMAIPEAHHLLGAALAWAGELEHAAQSLQIALKFAPKNRESLAFAAEVERARGNAASAAELHARLVECSVNEADRSAPPQLNRHSARHAQAWNERERS